MLARPIRRLKVLSFSVATDTTVTRSNPVSFILTKQTLVVVFQRLIAPECLHGVAGTKLLVEMDTSGFASHKVELVHLAS